MNLPAIGFGCSPIRHGGRGIELEGAVRTAVAAGYRLFDVAEVYGNERAVGRALRQALPPDRSVRRRQGLAHQLPAGGAPARVRELAARASVATLSTSICCTRRRRGSTSARSKSRRQSACEEFERRALPRDDAGRPRTDEVPLAETWAAMRDLERRGLAGAIGVSNFGPRHLEALGDLPAANQIATSPYQDNRATIDWCRERGVRLLSHSPLSVAGLLGEPLLQELAASYRCSAALVVLGWILQKGLVPLPSSTDPAHIRENLRALDFELSPAAIAAVDSLAGGGAEPLAPLT